MTVLTACLGHETNTFAARPTTLEDFRRGSPATGPGEADPTGFASGNPILRAYAGTRTVHGGLIAEARRQGRTLNPLLWTFATPGGTVTEEAYDYLKALLLDRLRAARGYAGVILDLHGAMVAEGQDDAEGDLLTAVRLVIGPQTPLIATLDLHANISARMVLEADMLIGFDEYPHTDMFERGVEAVQAMAAMLDGSLRPAMAYRPLPLLTMPPRQCTLIEPMRSLLETAHALEKEPGMVNVTLAMGFPFADIPDTGVSVLATANGDMALARRSADRMAAAIWKQRAAFDVELTPVADAIAYARTQAKGPVVLADGSDNPGGGAPGDGTVILRQLLEEGFPGAVVAAIADPEAVARAVGVGVGASVTLELGGKTDDRHGAPVWLTATVRRITDGSFVQESPMGAGVRAQMGATVVLAAGGVEIVVTERRIQPYDTALLRSVGIEPEKRRLIALKSSVHFRSAYEGLAERIFDADTPGIHRPDPHAYPYRRLRRPFYPMDPVTTDFEP